MNSIDIIAGARPNFVKIGPIIHAIKRHNLKSGSSPIKYRLIHTGQHYDSKMSGSFFEQLNIPAPDLNLEVGSGTQAYQTGQIMLRYEEALSETRPDLCLVVGDVTSTMSCAIVAKKYGMKVGHVEGGIRSRDLRMPEEINRLVTDSITDYFFTTTEQAGKNLLSEGKSESQILFVGNTMIDSLFANLSRLREPEILKRDNIDSGTYLVATLHRPSNVDSAKNLSVLLSLINENSGGKKIIFPMHPRTRKVFETLSQSFDDIVVTEPMEYLQFIYLIKNSAGVITDSGGITEETTVLNIPCITLRDSTERPETVTLGTNELVGTDPANIVPYLVKMSSGQWKKGSKIRLWDGHTADRIVEHLVVL